MKKAVSNEKKAVAVAVVFIRCNFFMTKHVSYIQ